MYHILAEDLAKLYPSINNVIKLLSSGTQKVEMLATIGEDLPVFRITGYWITNGIRLDIRLVK